MNEKMFNDIWNKLSEMGYDDKNRFAQLWGKITPFIHPDTTNINLLYCDCDDIYCLQLCDCIGVYELIQFDFDMNKIYLHDDILNYNGCEPDPIQCNDCFYYMYNHGYIENGYIFTGVNYGR